MKRLTLVAFLLALVASAVVATSTAATKPQAIKTSWLCNPFSTSLTPTTSLLSTRGGVRREPGLAEAAADVPDYARHHGGPNFRVVVDVFVHSITDGTTGAVTNKDIDNQIQVMNNGFSGREGGVDTGFRFRLRGVDRTDNAAWFNGLAGSKEERQMKKALHRGDASDLNIYLSTAEDFLGWSYFPSDYQFKPWRDGLVVDWESMLHTSTTYEGAYDLGKTATHEAGHWLGLYHVFQGGCNKKGDRVDDTPRQEIATFGCPEGQDSCPQPGLDSIHNYMDYSFDACYTEFTAGQTARMQEQWNFWRANGGWIAPQ
jgi:Pregnancy-associated plasma protein-A